MIKLMKLCGHRLNVNIILFLTILILIINIRKQEDIPRFSNLYKLKVDRIYLNFSNEKIHDTEIRISGLSGWEPWGRWIDGNMALIDMHLVMSGNITYKIKYNCLSNDQPQGMSLYFGLKRVYVHIGKCIGNSKIIENKIDLKNFSFIKIIPNYNVSVQGDPRKLSIGLISIELTNDL